LISDTILVDTSERLVINSSEVNLAVVALTDSEITGTIKLFSIATLSPTDLYKSFTLVLSSEYKTATLV
jgi:hypothetical protein